MQLSVTQKRKWNSAFKITISSVIIACVYPLFADGFDEILPYINALSIGLIGGVMVSVIELEIFDPVKRRPSFITNLFLKTSIYFVFFALLIPTVIGFNNSIYFDQGFEEYLTSDKFRNFIFKEDYDVLLFYSFIFIGIIIFTRQINKKLGQGVLLDYITGRYHHPKEVERIFMYLDLRSSTTIAEKLGEIRFHNFIHDFFLDITDAILSTKGVIYNYVGDQIVVTWNMKTGLEKANCIMTYFKIKSHTKKIREKYLKTYDTVPRFSTSFHAGKVIIGELGHVKSQIVYQGEVLYQTALIEKQFSNFELEEQILVSENLINQVPIPSLFKVLKVTEVDNFGKGTLDVYTLLERTDH